MGEHSKFEAEAILYKASKPIEFCLSLPDVLLKKNEDWKKYEIFFVIHIPTKNSSRCFDVEIRKCFSTDFGVIKCLKILKLQQLKRNGIVHMGLGNIANWM